MGRGYPQHIEVQVLMRRWNAEESERINFPSIGFNPWAPVGKFRPSQAVDSRCSSFAGASLERCATRVWWKSLVRICGPSFWWSKLINGRRERERYIYIYIKNILNIYIYIKIYIKNDLDIRMYIYIYIMKWFPPVSRWCWTMNV